MSAGTRLSSPSTALAEGGGAVLNDEQWTEIVAAATKAPSIHNTQPWLFAAFPDRLEVSTDPERALPVLDPSGRQRVISCGVAVEFAAVAARAAGHTVVVEHLPDAGDPDHLATVRVGEPTEAGEADREMAAAVAHRHTQRGAFLSRAVPADLVDRLQEEAGEFGVWLKQISSSEEEVATVFLISRAEELEQQEPAYLAELSSWMRTDPGAVDGVPVDTVPGADPATRPSNWLIRDFVVGSRPEQAHPAALDPDAPPPAVERPTVLMLGTANDDREAWLDAGRALGRLLLRATVAGLAASPLTQALDWPATRLQLRSRLSLVGHPQMLLRLGYSATQGAVSGRRPVSEVLRTS
jgi:nitroreductase